MNKNKTTTSTTYRAKSTDKAKTKESTSKRGKSEQKTAKRRVAKEKDENAPKKGLSAYIFFCQDERPKAKADGVEGKDLMKECGERWAKVSEKDKKKYEDMAAKDKERYERECEEAGISKEKSKSKTEAKDGKKSVGKKTEKVEKSKKADDKKKKSTKKKEESDEEEDDE